MPLPAWVLAAAMHPEVHRAGLSALKRAGTAVTKRLGRAPAADEDEAGAPHDAAPLRDAVEALPTRVELAEAIAAIDSRNEQRFVALRRLLIFGLAAQAGFFGLVIWLT